MFTINGVDLDIGLTANGRGRSFQVSSVPRPYRVDFYPDVRIDEDFISKIFLSENALLLVDEKIFNEYFSRYQEIKKIPTFVLRATEDFKNINTVLRVVDFLAEHNASKSSMLYVVGGGIVQDLGAFAAYMYKRGVPWTFVPTTLLSQGDSCVGGKTALNYEKTKNLLALFSAPRRIVIATGFLRSLSHEDWLSGGGEILRLCITGGEYSLHDLECHVDSFLCRDLAVTAQLIEICLAVKKAVVEYDEFELDTRRCMNYGHSFGHALEALTDYKIPHGIGVALGILVENEISYLRGTLDQQQRDRIITLANKLVSESIWKLFSELRLHGILELFQRDKKAEGATLKIATLACLGRIDFIDLPLDEIGVLEVKKAYTSVVNEIGRLRNG